MRFLYLFLENAKIFERCPNQFLWFEIATNFFHCTSSK